MTWLQLGKDRGLSENYYFMKVRGPSLSVMNVIKVKRNKR